MTSFRFFGVWLFTGLLILCDVAILYNWPKIVTNRIIHEKSQNLYKIAQFKKKRTKISLNVKFSDNLSVISRSFFFQKASKITWKPSFLDHANRQAFYASFYMLGTWCWFSILSEWSLARNKQSLNCVNIPITIIDIFLGRHLIPSYLQCRLGIGVKTARKSLATCSYFVLIETNILIMISLLLKRRALLRRRKKDRTFLFKIFGQKTGQESTPKEHFMLTMVCCFALRAI